jgi:hypothetical protein
MGLLAAWSGARSPSVHFLLPTVLHQLWPFHTRTLVRAGAGAEAGGSGGPSPTPGQLHPGPARVSWEVPPDLVDPIAQAVLNATKASAPTSHNRMQEFVQMRADGGWTGWLACSATPFTCLWGACACFCFHLRARGLWWGGLCGLGHLCGVYLCPP